MLRLSSSARWKAMAGGYVAENNTGVLRLPAGYIQTRIDEAPFRPIDPLLAARAFIGMVVHHRLAA